MTDWQPIETAPNDGNFRLYGLWVRGRAGTWFEAYYLARDEDDGRMLETSTDIFSAWSFEDFTHWADAPAPPSGSDT
jgi:hypothetical protein